MAARAKQAFDEGYRHIKLHETEEAEVRAARLAVGEGVAIMVDTNCPWTPEQARHMTLKLRPYDLHWLEEPIFPPEDFAAIAKLRAGTGVPMAAGENNCTSFQFRDMFAAGAVDYAQPSVTKVGGVTEFLKVATLADAAGVTLMPHSPYFGPGFLATLQLMAARGAPDGMIERYHMDLEASLYGELVMPVNGGFVVPTGSGPGTRSRSGRDQDLRGLIQRSQDMKSTILDYQDGAVRLKGVLNQDEERIGGRPAVVLFPDARGIGDHAIECAGRLAALGYVTLVADLYGDGTRARDMAQAMELMNGLRSDAGSLASAGAGGARRAG